MRKVRENSKTALFGAIPKDFFQSHHKIKSLGLRLLWFFCHCFVDGNNVHLVDFYDTRLNEQNRITGSLHHLTLTPFWQIKRQRKYSLQAWPWQPFRMFSPEYFCPNHQRLARKKFKNFWNWEGVGGKGGKLQPQAPPWPERQEFWSEFVDFVCTDFVHI